MSINKIYILIAIILLVLSSCSKNKTWTLQTDDTKMVIGVDSNEKMCLFEISTPDANWNWIKSPSVFTLMNSVFIDGKTMNLDWIYQSANLEENDGTKLTLIFANAQPAMELKSVWHARPGKGPIRHSMYLTNNSGETMRIYEQESMVFCASGPAKNTTVRYVNDDGSSPDSIGVYNDELTAGYSKSLRISEDAKDWIPFVVLDAGSKHGVYVGWEWSIGWMNIKENKGEGIVLKAGNGENFRTDIYAGETFEVPAAFIGAYNGDIDDCGNSLRKYLYNYSMPDILKNDTSYPKTEWNAFAATGKTQGSWDPVESKYYPLIDDIAPLGFDEIVIDVGWWSDVINKNPYTGEEPWKLYQDPFHYIADTEDWPSGMPAAAQYAHDHGMRFGLYSWIKPEFLLSDSGKSRIISQLTYLFKDLKADFYRSDNIILFSDNTIKNAYGDGRRAHYPEDVGYWSTKGYYEVIDSMIENVPGFSWENCSNGGRIKDYGALKRAVRVQNQDIYWPISARQSFYDASHALHPMQISAMTGSWIAWQATGSVYEFRSSSMGSSVWHPDAPNGGNGGPFWSTQQRDEIKKAVSTYKNKLRPLIRNGNLYHILPRPDDIEWDGIEYYDASTQKGVVYIFKPNSNIDNQLIKLRGLDADIVYSITFEDGTNDAVILKGSELMDTGISVLLEGKFVSELMFFEMK